MIPNHYAPRLSDLDRMIAQSVPPGGNWKNVPLWIPSARLKQIRASFAAGEGSRSTYYGRLKADAPAYTINTYFGRPGNGCHFHYDFTQHRTLSQREAARLQSFPDDFLFHGAMTSISRQIGNAVPPLLAFHVATGIPKTGYFVDLFSGAGGLSLGFQWAGWKPIIANDVDPAFLATYNHNVHNVAIRGDIRNPDVLEAITSVGRATQDSGAPTWVLGGPPCQGFSTAGNKRSLDDERNWLFRRFADALDRIQPAGFVFENVAGLLNMERGAVFDLVLRTLAARAGRIFVWKLAAESYGIPQRRTRLFIVGDNTGTLSGEPPQRLTGWPPPTLPGLVLPVAPTVKEALSDLPPLQSGEDGTGKPYLNEPDTSYQRLVRSRITPREYLASLQACVPDTPKTLRTAYL